MLRGSFGMDDLLKQLRMIQQLGPLRDVIGQAARCSAESPSRSTKASSARSRR